MEVDFGDIHHDGELRRFCTSGQQLKIGRVIRKVCAAIYSQGVIPTRDQEQQTYLGMVNNVPHAVSNPVPRSFWN